MMVGLRVVRGRQIGDGHCGGYDASGYSDCVPGGSVPLQPAMSARSTGGLPPVVEIKQRPGLARADWVKRPPFLD